MLHKLYEKVEGPPPVSSTTVSGMFYKQLLIRNGKKLVKNPLKESNKISLIKKLLSNSKKYILAKQKTIQRIPRLKQQKAYS